MPRPIPKKCLLKIPLNFLSELVRAQAGSREWFAVIISFHQHLSLENRKASRLFVRANLLRQAMLSLLLFGCCEGSVPAKKPKGHFCIRVSVFSESRVSGIKKPRLRHGFLSEYLFCIHRMTWVEGLKPLARSFGVDAGKSWTNIYQPIFLTVALFVFPKHMSPIDEKYFILPTRKS